MFKRLVVRLGAVAVVAAGSVAALSGCAVAPDVPVTEIKQPMSIHEARVEARKLRGYTLCSGTSIAASCSSTIKSIAVHSDALIINGNWRLELAKLPAPLISYAHLDSAPSYFAINPGAWVWTGYGPGGNKRADSFANAILVLKRAASPEAKAQDEAAFKQAVKMYRDSGSTLTNGEEVRRFQVQAESAVRDKKFDDAADLYGEALNVAPWWPAGHFNRALVLSEVGDYGQAELEMKRYLALVPNAPNARSAQDKIYEWERKAGQ